MTKKTNSKNNEFLLQSAHSLLIYFIVSWSASITTNTLILLSEKKKKQKINSMSNNVDSAPLQLCPYWKMHWAFSFSHKCWCITPLACGLWTFSDKQLSHNVSITNLIDFSFQAKSIRRTVFCCYCYLLKMWQTVLMVCRAGYVWTIELKLETEKMFVKTADFFSMHNCWDRWCVYYKWTIEWRTLPFDGLTYLPISVGRFNTYKNIVFTRTTTFSRVKMKNSFNSGKGSGEIVLTRTLRYIYLYMLSF